MKQRVYITGANMITALGLNIDENWKNLLEGKSGVSKIKHFDTSKLDTGISALFPEGLGEYASKFGKKRLFSQMTNVTKAGYVCALEAVERSNIDFTDFEPVKCGAIFGIVSPENNSLEADSNKHYIIKSMNNALPAWLSIHYNLQGPSFSVSCACSSSAYAIGLAYDMIKNGVADIMIVGGSDSIVNPEEISGFNEIFALSTNNDNPEGASRPFSKTRDGFVPGEGTGVVILESEESAQRRNAEVIAEILGYATTSEAFNIMAPRKDGGGMLQTMSKALDNAALKPEDIDYINAHGTSTTLNDMYETMAIKSLFKEHAYKLAVSSTKSMIGHTIGAAGVIELIVTAMSIKNKIITPTINFEDRDDNLDLDYVVNKARKLDIKTAISNSFAFGGHNASIIIRGID